MGTIIRIIIVVIILFKIIFSIKNKTKKETKKQKKKQKNKQRNKENPPDFYQNAPPERRRLHVAGPVSRQVLGSESRWTWRRGFFFF